MNMRWIYISLLPIILGLAACAGMQTFTPAARAGDTVTLAVGWQQHLVRQNLTVTITGSDNVTTTYVPGDSRVRAILNLYPDPASYAVVDTATKRSTNGYTIGNLINTFVTNNDNEWYQSSVVLDLPASLPAGTATITLTDSGGASFQPISVTILAGVGSSNLFNIYNPWGNPYTLLDKNSYPYAMQTFEREPGNTVTFASTPDANGNTVIPHSIQLQFSHTAGTGKTWVVNPRGDIKDIMWRDDGSIITVMLLSTRGSSLTQMLDFKFYLSGGIANLGPVANSLKAYDINGTPVAGITATIQ